MFIPDPSFFIPDPGSRVDKIPDPGSGSKNVSILNKKNDTKFSKIKSGQFIPDPGSGFFSILDPGSRGQKSTGYLILNTKNCKEQIRYALDPLRYSLGLALKKVT
jgi:hypothetical protein